MRMRKKHKNTPFVFIMLRHIYTFCGEMAFFRDEFRDDPFFNGGNFHRPFMMNFPDPFGDFFARQQRPAIGSSQSMGVVDPFQRMNEMMRNMHRFPSTECQTFTQSTVMHYSHNPSTGGVPEMYQASVSTRSGPGGLKETKKLEKNSVTGTQKTSVSHHIGDCSHTVKKHYNYKTKEAEQIQEFVNMDEDDAKQFHANWRQKSQRLNRIDHQTTLGLPSSSHPAPTYGRCVNGGPSKHGGELQRSPRFNPYSGEKQAHERSKMYERSTHNPDPQRPKKKKSSQVKVVDKDF